MLSISEKQKLNIFKKGPVHRSLFSNGASVVTHYAQGFSGAKVLLNFLAGSAFEKVEQEGIAHLIEHLIFKENQSNLISQLEHLGAELNAYTYKESVCFEMNCLGTRLDQILPIFLECFMQLDFLDSQLLKEKQIIKQELKEDKDDHEAQGIEFIFKKNFNQAYGHPVGGSASQVLKYKRKDIEKYYKKYFSADRTSLVIVSGNPDFDGAGLLQSWYEKRGQIKNKVPYRIKKNKHLKKINHFNIVKKKKIESPILYFSFDGPSMMCSEYMSYVVLDEILFEGISSIFFKKMREESPLVYGFGSSINSFGTEGNYLMIFNSQEKNFEAIEQILEDVLKNIVTYGIPSHLIDSIKLKISDSWSLSFDDLAERADYLLENEIYDMNDLTHSKLISLLNVVGEDSIKKIITNFYFKNKISRLKILKE
jgi:predicted Zn-dependent peptidase